MRIHVFAMLLCVLSSVGPTSAGSLFSIRDRFVMHLMECASSTKDCDNKCYNPSTSKMLTRDGWVFTPEDTNATCISKCKRVAVTECLGTPDVIVGLL